MLPLAFLVLQRYMYCSIFNRHGPCLRRLFWAAELRIRPPPPAHESPQSHKAEPRGSRSLFALMTSKSITTIVSTVLIAFGTCYSIKSISIFRQKLGYAGQATATRTYLYRSNGCFVGQFYDRTALSSTTTTTTYLSSASSTGYSSPMELRQHYHH
jgi:hypothetical protein